MIHCFDSRFVQEGTASENTTEDETEISEEKTKLKPSTSKISTIKKTSLTKKITHSVNRSIQQYAIGFSPTLKILNYDASIYPQGITQSLFSIIFLRKSYLMFENRINERNIITSIIRTFFHKNSQCYAYNQNLSLYVSRNSFCNFLIMRFSNYDDLISHSIFSLSLLNSRKLPSDVRQAL